MILISCIHCSNIIPTTEVPVSLHHSQSHFFSWFLTAPSGAQGLILAVFWDHSWAWGIVCGAREQTSAGCLQDKNLNHHTIPLALQSHFLLLFFVLCVTPGSAERSFLALLGDCVECRGLSLGQAHVGQAPYHWTLLPAPFIQLGFLCWGCFQVLFLCWGWAQPLVLRAYSCSVLRDYSTQYLGPLLHTVLGTSWVAKDQAWIGVYKAHSLPTVLPLWPELK